MGECVEGERRVERQSLDAINRALAPLVTFSVILLLGCADALMVAESEPVRGDTGDRASISLDAIPTGAIGEEGLKLEAPPLLVVRISRGGTGRELLFGVDGAYRIYSVASGDPLAGERDLVAAGNELGLVRARANGSEVVLNGH
ncbi:MAG: hypothetical protein V2A76_06945, partial [Planctomycetota bacterium]